jgi:2-methylcitrate dehydratase PrpD
MIQRMNTLPVTHSDTAITPSPTHVLGEFAMTLEFEALPGPVVLQAKLSLLNFLACAVAGAEQTVVQKTINALRPYQARGRASLICHEGETDPVSAAFVNCLSSTILAFDETHARGVVHPVGPVAAAALAMAEERRLDGRRVIVALAAGVELASRASLAVSVAPAVGPVGWSQSAICGSIGAAAAVASLLSLDARSTTNAISLGANAGAGLRAMNGTEAVSHAVSNASANGLRAALFAQAGITACPTALEHPYGFAALFAQQPHLGHLTSDLGHHYALSELNFKPYPCGIVAHAAIDAAGAVRARNDLVAEDVEQVTVVLHPSCLALGDRVNVSNANEASVSIQYWVATGLLRDHPGTDCLSSDWIANPDRIRLQKRVHLGIDSNLGRDAAKLSVRLRTGAVLQADVDHCLGSQQRPMKLNDLEAKFLDAARGRLNLDHAEQVIKSCRNFEDVSDVGQVLQLLRRRTT